MTDHKPAAAGLRRGRGAAPRRLPRTVCPARENPRPPRRRGLVTVVAFDQASVSKIERVRSTLPVPPCR